MRRADEVSLIGIGVLAADAPLLFDRRRCCCIFPGPVVIDRRILLAQEGRLGEGGQVTEGSTEALMDRLANSSDDDYSPF